MQLTIYGKQLDVGDALRGNIEEQWQAVVGKYFEKPTNGHVTMSKKGEDIRADVIVHVGKGILSQCHAMAGDAYAAFDEATEHVCTRLRCYKRRLRDHHRDRADHSDTLATFQYVLEAEAEDQSEYAGPVPHQPIIVAEMETVIKKLMPGDSVVRMDIANLPALMFRNISHGGLNMIYRRADGNYRVGRSARIARWPSLG